MNEITNTIRFQKVNDKPIAPRAPARKDSNIGRFVDGQYDMVSLQPTSTVLIGSEKTNEIRSCLALWDTGEPFTWISDRIAKELGLSTEYLTQIVSLRIAVDIPFDNVELHVFDVDDYDPVDVHIGMDIISLGELCFVPDPENHCGLFRFIMP